MKVFTLIALALGVAVGVVFQGEFFQTIIISCVSIWVLAPSILALGICTAIRLLTERGPDWPVRGFAGFVIVAISLALSWGVGSGIHSYKVQSVRAYVAQAVPILDGIKNREGKYPSTLLETLIGTPPMLLRHPGAYSSSGETFRFEYGDSTALMGGYKFDSSKRQWVYFD